MTLVVDSSVTLAWCFADEQPPYAMRSLEVVSRGGAWVPGIWRYEIANALVLAERRGRVSEEWRRRVTQDLVDLEIRIDQTSDEEALGATVDLALRYRLTVYDAAFLETAQRRRLPLATLDDALVRSARAAGIEVLL